MSDVLDGDELIVNEILHKLEIVDVNQAFSWVRGGESYRTTNTPKIMSDYKDLLYSSTKLKLL